MMINLLSKFSQVFAHSYNCLLSSFKSSVLKQYNSQAPPASVRQLSARLPASCTPSFFPPFVHRINRLHTLLQQDQARAKTKKENGLSLNAEIEGIEIPDILEAFRGTLTRMHKLL